MKRYSESYEADCYRVLQSAVAFSSDIKWVGAVSVTHLGSLALWILVCLAAAGCSPRGEAINGSERFQLASSSMAPRLLGPHFIAHCPRCGKMEANAIDAFDAHLPTRCFACGAVCNVDHHVRSGAVVEIVRTQAESLAARFEVVVYAANEKDATAATKGATQLTAKRVWALPGEQVELRDGEIWIDGVKLQKAANEMGEVSIPIGRFPRDARSHWCVRDTTSDQATRIEEYSEGGQYRLSANQQLEFRYARPSRDPELQALIPSRLVDEYPCNQNSTAALHELSDYIVAVDLAAPARMPWSLHLHSPAGPIAIQVAAESVVDTASVQASNWDSNRPFGDPTIQIPATRCVVAAVCDGRLLVSTKSFDWQFPLSELQTSTLVNGSTDELEHRPSLPLASIRTEATLTIKRLMFARDLWLGPKHDRLTQGPETEHPTARAGYFVMGDNLPLSLDSRDPSIGRIAPSQVVGRVINGDSSKHWIDKLLTECDSDSK